MLARQAGPVTNPVPIQVEVWRPILTLVACVLVLVLLVGRWRVHPFLALLAAAWLAGWLTPADRLMQASRREGLPHAVRVVEVASSELGSLCGRVGIVIALASILGVCLLESGAADKVVRRFLAVTGERRAGLALVSGGFVLSLPIFFDTFFMLLIPLARALRLRTGKDYTLYVLAICCAGAVTHSLVAPHPGALAMAEILKVDLGWSVIIGTLCSIPTVAAGWQVARWLNRRYDLPMRETPGLSLADLEAIARRPESELPCLVAALGPVLLPLGLISVASFSAAFVPETARTGWGSTLEWLGHRNVALAIGALWAMRLAFRHTGRDWNRLSRLMGQALETAGVVVLITSAGGAFGMMLKHAGVGEAVQALATSLEANFLVLAWAVAVLMKFAQGSATVSMLTTAGMMAGMAQSGELPYHPMYLFLAIGFGALGISWMNDSGFWVIGRLSGFTERETLATWTVLAFSMSVTGLLLTLLLAAIYPAL
ncbi:MAG: SLC13 family permease [Verrucomicrobiota bacterium]|nr:GntP family permease [Limisphaera sp.]MDW8380565.1 SLC13 family permease [Verrucomicrobiota bacterium]